MRVSRIGIFTLAAFVVLGTNTAVRADIALCNRFMAFVARARGDATGEFKRRIAFLLETGKIGEAELARMAASEIAVSPFESDRHQSADILPHARAFDELIGKERLNWDEVKRFISDTQGELKRDGENKKTHEKETEAVFYPQIVRTVPTKVAIYDTPRLFEYKGIFYAAIAAQNCNYYVIDIVTGQVMRTVEMGSSPVASPSIFVKNGEPYLFIGSKDSEAIITPALRSGRSTKIAMRWGNRTEAVAYSIAGRPYFATASFRGKRFPNYGLNLFDARRGRRVATIKLSGVEPKRPAIFESNKVPYVFVASEPNHVEIVNAATGAIIHRTALPDPIRGAPIIFKNGSEALFALAAGKGIIYIGKALTGEITQTVRIQGEDYLRTPISFEHAGIPYLVIWKGHPSNTLFVIDARTGSVVKKIVTEESDLRPPAVFEIEGVPHLVIASDRNGIYVVEALTGKVVQRLAARTRTNFLPVVFERDGSDQAVVVLHDNSLSTVWLGGVFPKEKETK